MGLIGLKSDIVIYLCFSYLVSLLIQSHPLKQCSDVRWSCSSSLWKQNPKLLNKFLPLREKEHQKMKMNESVVPFPRMIIYIHL